MQYNFNRVNYKINMIKKIAVITMVIAMLLPTTVSATTVSEAMASCPPHEFVKVFDRTIGSNGIVSSHEYVYGYVYDNKGNIIDVRKGTCNIIEYVALYLYKCRICGIQVVVRQERILHMILFMLNNVNLVT